MKKLLSKKVLSFVVIVILLYIMITIFNFDDSKSSNKASIELAGVKPELIYEEDGKTYYVVNGNFYEKEGETLKFIDTLYDPDYYKKNYVTENRIIYQIDPQTGTRYKVLTSFKEGFENAETLQDLLTPDRWHNSNVDPARKGQANNYYNLGNRIGIAHDIVRSGTNSLKSVALANANDVSKSSINRGIMYYKKGDNVYFSGWYYFEKTPSLYDAGGLTIFDLESNWIRNIGIRLIIRYKDALSAELEFPKTQFRQEQGKEVSFPTGKWVNVKGQIYLSDKDGFVKLWQDGVLILNKKGRTLPLANIVYDKIETGITAMAKGSKYSQTLYVDDFVISKSSGGGL